MKRSEALREIPEAVGVRNMQAPWWEAVVKYFEDRVGVVWDPEEEPLPEEICWRLEKMGVATIRALPKQGKSEPLSPAAANEVCRRYRTFPKLQAEILRIRPYASVPTTLDYLLAIIDGKEE